MMPKTRQDYNMLICEERGRGFMKIRQQIDLLKSIRGKILVILKQKS